MVLERLQDRIREAEQQLKEVQARIDALRLAYAEVESILGLTTYSPPSASQALQSIMEEDARIWTMPELVEELHKRNWYPRGSRPDATLRSALVRLKQAGIVEVVNRGRYRISTPGSQIVEENAISVEVPENTESIENTEPMLKDRPDVTAWTFPVIRESVSFHAVIDEEDVSP
jgi:hypothetical protein